VLSRNPAGPGPWPVPVRGHRHEPVVGVRAVFSGDASRHRHPRNCRRDDAFQRPATSIYWRRSPRACPPRSRTHAWSTTPNAC
jgi:hypothetical protein